MTDWNDAFLKAKHGGEFRRCLIELDWRSLSRIWNEVAPYAYQPRTRKEYLYAMHLARTETQTLPIKLRQYSDRWLRDRGFGSFLDRRLQERASVHHIGRIGTHVQKVKATA